MERLASTADATIYHALWEELSRHVDICHALMVDAPYSSRTHSAHDDGAQTANRAASWAGKNAVELSATVDGRARAKYDANNDRRKLNYKAWTSVDVDAFVDCWAPKTKGWMVSLTDHMLAPAWTEAMERHGRYVFSPIACVEPGSRVRMVGDGPAQWSCWAIVSRPKKKPYSKWGALPGAYVVPAGACPRAKNGGKKVVGGKPLWLMERLVEDYSRPGDLVVDPCCGAGTTILAAVRTGRRGIGGDAMLEHAQLAADAISSPVQRPMFVEGA